MSLINIPFLAMGVTQPCNFIAVQRLMLVQNWEKEKGSDQAANGRLYYFYFLASQHGTEKCSCLLNLKETYVIVFEKCHGFANIFV